MCKTLLRKLLKDYSKLIFTDRIPSMGEGIVWTGVCPFGRSWVCLGREGCLPLGGGICLGREGCQPLEGGGVCLLRGPAFLGGPAFGEGAAFGRASAFGGDLPWGGRVCLEVGSAWRGQTHSHPPPSMQTSPPTPSRYGQPAVGTQPTGMHSCQN